MSKNQRTALSSYIHSHLKVRHLELLIALNDMGGLGRVADALHVTQPAVSKTLAALEEGMGLMLFERTPRGLVATALGECLVRHARSVLAELREAEKAIGSIIEGRTVRTAIGILPMAAVTVMPHFVAELEARAPEVMVSVVEGSMEILLTRLRAGDIDFALSFLTQTPLDTPLAADVLVDDSLAACVRCGHPLESAATLDWQMLMAYPMVLPPQSSWTRGMIDRLWNERGMSLPPRQVESLSIMTNVGVLQTTDSVALLLGSVAKRFERLGLLCVLPLDFSDLRIKLGLLWRTDREPSRAHELVRQVFQQTKNEMGVL